MAVNRFLQPSVYNYESQFVPTNVPFEMLAKAGAAKQEQQNLLKAKEQTLLDLTPAGIDELVYGPTGQRKYLGEKQQSRQLINQFNQKVLELSSKPVDRMGPEYMKEINALRKEYSQLKGILGTLKEREEKYKGLQSEFGKAKDINKAQWLANPYLDEVLKLGQDSGYVPQESLNYGTYVDRIKTMQESIDKIKASKSAWASAKEGYINKGSLTELGQAKLAKVAKEVLQEQGLIPDITSQVDYAIKLGKINPQDREKEIEKYANNLVQYAMDHAWKTTTADKTGDATWRYLDEKNEGTVIGLETSPTTGMNPILQRLTEHQNASKAYPKMQELEQKLVEYDKQMADYNQGKASRPTGNRDLIEKQLNDLTTAYENAKEVERRVYERVQPQLNKAFKDFALDPVVLNQAHARIVHEGTVDYLNTLPDEHTNTFVSIPGKHKVSQSVATTIATNPNGVHITDEKGNKVDPSMIDASNILKSGLTTHYRKNANGNIEITAPIIKTSVPDVEVLNILGKEVPTSTGQIKTVYQNATIELKPNSWIALNLLESVASNESLPTQDRQAATVEFYKQKMPSLYKFEKDYFDLGAGNSQYIRTTKTEKNEKGVPVQKPIFVKVTKSGDPYNSNTYSTYELKPDNFGGNSLYKTSEEFPFQQPEDLINRLVEQGFTTQ